MGGVITITTDFGTLDPTVGIMKGVMLSVNPSLTIIDITHKIEPQNITNATICVGCFNDYFPQDTIHLVVVDPGVGTTRDPVIVQTERYYYIGPNNGIFSHLDSPVKKMVKIENKKFFRSTVSSTFQGRDIFSPVAAHLVTTPIEEFGPPLEELERFAIPEPVISETGLIQGEIIYFDHFGNAFTNIKANEILGLLKSLGANSVEINMGEHLIGTISKHYKAVDNGTLGAVINSFDYLELVTPNGNAQDAFELEKGNPVSVVFHSEE